MKVGNSIPTFFLLISFLLTEVKAHGTQIRECVTTERNLRFFIAHWHGALDSATTAGTLRVRNNTDGEITTLVGNGVLNDQLPLNPAETGCLNNGITTPVNSCVDNDSTATGSPNDDWVYFDFNVECNIPVDYTLIQGETIYLTNGCITSGDTPLYPVTLKATYNCDTPSPTSSPTVAPTSGPTALTQAPTPAPSPAPNIGPTQVPTPAPTPVPNADPTPNPTPANCNEILTCTDAGTEFKYGSERKGCKWLKNNPSQKDEYCKSEDIKSHCPVTCDACDSYTNADSNATFYLWGKNRKKPKKSCKWVKKKYFKLSKRCSRIGVRTTCRVACACA